MRLRKRRQSNGGFTLIELLITVSVLGIVLSVGALNLRPLNDDAQNAATQLGGLLKQTRAKAMATTSAYRIWSREGSAPGRVLIYAQRANTCSAPSNQWVTDSKLQTELPKGVTLNVAFDKWDWQIPCFDSRGRSKNYIKLKLKDDRERVREVELLLGGAVRIK